MIVAQLSDPHITSSDAPGGAAERLRNAVRHLTRLPTAPHLVFVTGDCVDGGTAEEYERFRELIRPLPMPVYVVPGNHDDRARMLSAFGGQGESALPGFVQFVVDAGPMRLVALDTHVPGRDHGELCAERLGWLDARLAEAPDRPTLLFMHHPPVPCGVPVLDAIALAEPGALGALVRRHPQVEVLAAGHIHSTLARRFHGALAVTCASAAHQMLPDFGEEVGLSVVMEPPSCLLHVWDDRAGLSTRVSQIGEWGGVRRLHDGTRWV